MSHEIDTTTGTPAVFVTNTPAWHGLGHVIDHAATSREAIKFASLDWQVEQWPVLARNPQTFDIITGHDHVANVRTDTQSVLGVVGRRYHVFQNADAFDFMDALVGDKLAMYETAGALRSGRKVWMLARIPGEYRVGPDDVVKPYVLLVNSHDGSTALRMIPTSVRVVCQNTLNLALHQAGSEGLAIRHRPSLADRVREAREKLGIVAARFNEFDAELHAMIARTLSARQVHDYFDNLLPKPETDRQRDTRRKTMRQFIENFESPTNTFRGMAHTPWAVYNAVSEWADHQRSFRGAIEQHRAESRLNSVWFGSSNQIKQRAYSDAFELARTGG